MLSTSAALLIITHCGRYYVYCSCSYCRLEYALTKRKRKTIMDCMHEWAVRLLMYYSNSTHDLSALISCDSSSSPITTLRSEGCGIRVNWHYLSVVDFKWPLLSQSQFPPRPDRNTDLYPVNRSASLPMNNTYTDSHFI